MKRKNIEKKGQDLELPLVRKVESENICNDENGNRSSYSGYGIITLISEKIFSFKGKNNLERALPPLTGVLVVFTMILHMTIGAGAALRPIEQINEYEEQNSYKLAMPEQDVLEDASFSRGQSENLSGVVISDDRESDEDSVENESDKIASEDEMEEEQSSDITEVEETSETEVNEPSIEETSAVETEEALVFETIDQTLFLKSNMVNIRSEPSTDSDVLDTAAIGQSIRRIGVSELWSKVALDGGVEGYIMNEYLTETPPPTPTPTPTPAPTATPTPVPAPEVVVSPSSAISAQQQQEMVSLAYSFIGNRYVYAGSQPGSFDCSGFTSYIYRTMFGIDLPRTTTGQIARGISVPISDIQIGDIICFDWKRNGSCDHVALYTGNGSYVHASYSRGRVAEGSINSATQQNAIMSVRRIIY